MGSFVSKRELGLLESGDDQSQFSSPPPVTEAPGHFLPRELDPRSPSAGIDRTPIPMSVPQETGSPNGGMITAAAPQEAVVDPRSPSVGIVRTPIVCLPSESGQCSLCMS